MTAGIDTYVKNNFEIKSALVVGWMVLSGLFLSSKSGQIRMKNECEYYGIFF